MILILLFEKLAVTLIFSSGENFGSLELSFERIFYLGLQRNLKLLFKSFSGIAVNSFTLVNVSSEYLLNKHNMTAQKQLVTRMQFFGQNVGLSSTLPQWNNQDKCLLEYLCLQNSSNFLAHTYNSGGRVQFTRTCSGQCPLVRISALISTPSITPCL